MDTLSEKEIEQEAKRQNDIKDCDEEIKLVKGMIDDSIQSIKKLQSDQMIQADDLKDTQQKEMADLILEQERIWQLMIAEHRQQMHSCQELLSDHHEHLATVEAEKKDLTDNPLVVP